MRSRRLTGGAVVSELIAGASANANNFLIRVATKPADKILHLTTTAASPNGKGSTSVRSVVRVQTRRCATSYAVESRRIVGLTPEGSSLPPPPPPPPPPPAPASGPVVTTGPCNEIASSWTDDFGVNDWTAEYWNLPSFSEDAPPGDPFAGYAGRDQDALEGRRLLRYELPRGPVWSTPTITAARFTTTIDGRDGLFGDIASRVRRRHAGPDRRRHGDQQLDQALPLDHHGELAGAVVGNTHHRGRVLRWAG